MTWPAHLLVLALVGSTLIAGCDPGTPPVTPARTETTQPTPMVAPTSTPPASPSPSVDVCSPRPSPGGRVTDPNGPYGHQVAIARTTDGIHLSGAHQVLDHASVPDAVALPDGSVRVYYINAEDGGIWVAKLEGEALTPLGPIAINGVPRPAGAVDPDATLLADGRIRLTYLGNLGPPQPGSSKPWNICMADSTDGLNFTLAGLAIQFTGEATTDPSVTRLTDGSWLMALSQGQKTILARSSDGLHFTQYDAVSYGGVPEVTALPDGRVRLYVCARGIEPWLSADKGITWSKEASDIAPNLGKKIVCDPSYAPAAGLFVYKTGT